MKVFIRKIILENFKGVREAEYDLSSPMVTVKGQNSAGKTTIATAHFWLWSDKNYELSSNPNIRPNDGRECIPKVTEVLDIDGVETTISKFQKMKTLKDNKVTITNHYEINGVDKNEKNFKAYLEEKGIDFANFLFLSNPNSFMGQKAKDMRTLLFGMTGEKSDYGIALMIPEAQESAELLKSYTFEEVSSMQKSTIKKITEVHGKSGELTQAKIQGLEMSKVDVDVAEQELLKVDLQRKIYECDEKMSDAGRVINDLRECEMKLQFELSGIQQRMNTDIQEKRRVLCDSIAVQDRGIDRAKSDINGLSATIEHNSRMISIEEEKKPEINKKYKENNAKIFDESTYLFDEGKWVFDESSTVCSLCGQMLPADKIEELKSDFERRKADAKAMQERTLESARDNFLEEKERLKEKLLDDANKIKSRIEELESANENLKQQISDMQNKEAECIQKKSDLEKQLSELPEYADYTQNEEYNKLKAEQSKVLEEIEKAVSDGSKEIVANANAEKQEYQNQLDEVNGTLAKASNNIAIDEKISELREKWSQYEQNKADAEKILHQLDLVSRKKNDLLSDEINKNFQYTKWVLFRYQKNGEYKEDCIPMIQDERGDWKEWEDMNGGLRVKCKLDVCQSLQRFFGTYYPIFLDEAAEVNNWNIPKSEDSQIILLKVTEDKELMIERRS